MGAVEQKAYRIYSDGTESGSVAFGDEDRGKALADDTVYLVRFLLQNITSTSTLEPKLQYRKRTTSAGGYGSWTDVNASSSNVRSAASSNITDDAVTTERMAGSGTFVAGRYDEVNGAITTSVSVDAGEDTEFLFAIKVRSAELDWRNNIELRLTDVSTGVYDTYTMLPYLALQGSVTEDFEGGVDTNAITTGNSNFDSIGGGDFNFDASPAEGSLSGLGAANPNVHADFTEILGPEMFWRIYMYATGARTVNTSFVRLKGDSSVTEILYVRWDNSPVRIYTSTPNLGSSFLGGTPAIDQWIRVEGRISRENVEGTQTGEIEVKYWNDPTDTGAADGSVDLDEETSEIIREFWLRSESSQDWNWDNVEVNNFEWPGPVGGDQFVTITEDVGVTDAALNLPFTDDFTAPILRDSQEAQVSTATEITIPQPTGLAVDDLMLLAFNKSGTSDWTSWPTTWNEENTVGANGQRFSLAWRIATQGDVDSWDGTWGWSGSADATGVIAAFDIRGVTPTFTSGTGNTVRLNDTTPASTSGSPPAGALLVGSSMTVDGSSGLGMVTTGLELLGNPTTGTGADDASGLLAWKVADGTEAVFEVNNAGASADSYVHYWWFDTPNIPWDPDKWTTSEEGSSSAVTDIQSNQGRMTAGTSVDDFSVATANSITNLQDSELLVEIDAATADGDSSGQWIYLMLRSTGEQVAANAGRPATAYYLRILADETDGPSGATLFRRIADVENTVDATLGLGHTGQEPYFVRMTTSHTVALPVVPITLKQPRTLPELQTTRCLLSRSSSRSQIPLASQTTH